MAGIIKTSINLTAIPKDKIIEGKKGKYIPITITVNNEVDAYGNHGPVCVAQSKEEREAKEQRTYLGNSSVVWTDGEFPSPVRRDNQPAQQSAPAEKNVAQDDLPF
jgi:hypothetical protein|tara:strand:+ start:251 stop:568 length:318 start_codon:yes stop_codon:yes gene_type:complete